MLERKAGAFELDVELKDGRNEEGSQVPKKTAKMRKGNEVDIDQAELEKGYHDALWEDSPGLEDETMVGALEEDLRHWRCNDGNHRFHRQRSPTAMEGIA